MDDNNLLERLVDTENRSKSNAHRLDSLEKDTKAIHDIAISVQVMAAELKHQGEKLEEVVSDVKGLKSEPVDRWKDICKSVITAIIAAVVGYAMGQLGF
jgi:glycerol-3-phosphate dehydrogenase